MICDNEHEWDDADSHAGHWGGDILLIAAVFVFAFSPVIYWALT